MKLFADLNGLVFLDWTDTVSILRLEDSTDTLASFVKLNGRFSTGKFFLFQPLFKKIVSQLIICELIWSQDDA